MAGMWIGYVSDLDGTQSRAALDSTVNPGVWGMYRFYAYDGSLLYVGITRHPWRRWKQHAASQEWWWDVNHITLIPLGSNAREVREFERLAIRQERPYYNKQHSPMRRAL